ncbi:LptF/LptG family permease [Maritalea sp.]|uniref:LptF/LptG family permease n=1 Tax=Maritalea sp. TaxID=2003361 RepID=UPI003EF6690E
MNRLGQHFTVNILRSILLVTFLFFCLVGLIEIVETGNRSNSGLFDKPWTTLAASSLSAAKWALDLLPISFLVGAVLALMDLQNNREIIVTKASGISIWGIALVPLATCVALGLLVSYLIEPLVLAGNEMLERHAGVVDAAQFDQAGRDRWIIQENEGGKYFIRSNKLSEDGLQMQDVFVFQRGNAKTPAAQIFAKTAQFDSNRWRLEDGHSRSIEGKKEQFSELLLTSKATKEEINLQLGAVHQMDIYTLREFLNGVSSIDDNVSAAQMRLKRMEVLPFLLVGSLLIAFAFTSGYRRHGTSGSQVLYGIILGFVLYVVTKLLDRSGGSGAMDATLAAWGPAIVAIVIGTSVLLWKEDG